ncbi:MAG: 23S rRNA (adenine(2503)-C(2))-methyltransferase RlmN, partial [Ruminococcus sp.]
MTDLKSMKIEEIQDFVEKHNFPKYRAEQIFRWVNTGVSSFDEMKNIPKDLRS